jgi:hypothetical protein
VCLIDTAPSLGVSMAAALYAADYVLSPIELEAYSIQGIKKMVMAIANVRKANPGLKFLGMVPSKIDGRNPRHGRHLQELANAYPQLMIPAGIGLAAASPMPWLQACRSGRSGRPPLARPRRKSAHWPLMFSRRWRLHNDHRRHQHRQEGQETARGAATGVRTGPR